MSGWVTVSGPPLADWASNARQHRPVRAEHVAEPHRDAVDVGLVGGVGRQTLGDPLRPPQHAGRVGGLVGADVDEPLDIVKLGGVEQVERAAHVGLPPLGGVRLEQWQVLECGGMEHDLRPMLGEDLVETGRIGMSATIMLGSSSIARPSIDSFVECRPFSSRSSIDSAAGSKRTIWRHNSLPIDPPAPVTSARDGR